jgi:hypothetical protein
MEQETSIKQKVSIEQNTVGKADLRWLIHK